MHSDSVTTQDTCPLSNETWCNSLNSMFCNVNPDKDQSFASIDIMLITSNFTKIANNCWCEVQPFLLNFSIICWKVLPWGSEFVSVDVDWLTIQKAAT